MTTTINISSTILTPAIALRELMAARGTTIVIANGDKKIDKLLETVPLISLRNGMRARPRATPGTPFKPEFDYTYLQGSTAGTRTPTESFDLTFMLEQGIMLRVKLASGSKPEFLSQENMAILTQDRKATKEEKAKGARDIIQGQREKLVEEYERALNECDFMLIMLYCAIMLKKGQSQYTEFVTLLENQLRFEKGAMKKMLESIPGTFLSTGENDLLYDMDYGLVGRRIRIPWLEEARGIGSLCTYIPPDYCPLDIGTSSYQLITNGAKGFKDPETLVTYLIGYNVSVSIQLYRLGKIVLDADRTEEIVRFLRTADITKIRELNHRDLVLMGGVLPRERFVIFVKKIVEAMLRDSNNIPPEKPDDDDLIAGDADDTDFRCGVLFCYLSSLSATPHCMIDLKGRKAEYNVAKQLLLYVDGKAKLNASMREALADIAFHLMSWLMEVDGTRLRSDIITTFNDFKYFLYIDPSAPLATDERGDLINVNLGIFQKQYLLSERFYCTGPGRIDIRPLSTHNEADRIVVIPEEEIKEGMPLYGSSVYIIYNKEGNVVEDVRGKSAGAEATDEFSILETDSLSKILASRDPDASVQKIQAIFSERNNQALKIPFVPTEGYHDLYIANLEGPALQEFRARVADASVPAVARLEEKKVSNVDNLWKPQIINLLQEDAVKKITVEEVDDLERKRSIIEEQERVMEKELKKAMKKKFFVDENTIRTRRQREFLMVSEVPKKKITKIESYYFLSPQQLHILGKTASIVKELREENQELGKRLSFSDKNPLMREIHNIITEYDEGGFDKTDVLKMIAAIPSVPHTKNDAQLYEAIIDSDKEAYTKITENNRQKRRRVNAVLRFPSMSGLYGEAVIDEVSKKVNHWKGLYNRAFTQQAPKPQAKRGKNNRQAPQAKQPQAAGGDDDSSDEETRAARRKQKKEESRNARKVDKYKANQAQKEQLNEEEEEAPNPEVKLFETQKHLSDLIHFATAFEMALAKFLGVDTVGPLTKKYLADAQAVIEEKLTQFRRQRETSVESILAAYGAHDAKNLNLESAFDLSRYQKVVPDATFIKKHNPGYFAIGGTRVASMIISTAQGDKPRFRALELRNDEIVMMARLEKTPALTDSENHTLSQIERKQSPSEKEVALMKELVRQKQWVEDFKELIAVLYHMMENLDKKEALETHTTIFKNMISIAYHRQ